MQTPAFPWRFIPLLLPLLIATPQGRAETVKDREGAVRQDRAAMEKSTRWIYNDFQRGLTEAKWKGKPLLVVLRCVPCLSCAGIDSSVLSEQELGPLLDKFVCVRVINANALDLAMFQFDYDLSFSTLFFNGDGTLYGRYGSWLHQKNPAEKTVAGYKQALEGALELHRQYPDNRAALAGKQGAPTPFKSPVEIPELAAKYKRELDWEGKVVQSCVHCHQIGDALRSYHRTQKQQVPAQLIYPMPPPETIGLTLAPEHRARVASVAAGSPARAARLQPGDDVLSLNGQPVISIADVSWALHRAPDSGALTATIRRQGAEQQVRIVLPAEWRSKADISRRVGSWQMRAMTSGGLVLEDLNDDERARRGLTRDSMALLVKSVGQYGKHAAARNAGFKKDDVLVEFGGVTRRVTEGELMGLLLQSQPAGTKVKTVALRGTEKVQLTMPMQ